MNYYAVKVGRHPGIYSTWEDCKREVTGYKGAIYKKFSQEIDALNFINEDRLDFQEEIIPREKEEFVAYVDGSFRKRDNTFSYGVYMRNPEEKWTFSKRFYNADATMRNVSGEIEGAMKAMEECIHLGGKVLHLHYDYEGIRAWALGDWKTNKEGTQNYKKFYEKASAILQVHFIKVKAHSGVKYNEIVDTLAKEAE